MIASSRSNNLNNPDIPVYGVVAERHALADVLSNIRHHRLTLVSAPPGYGKTTAIAHYARDLELPAAWHSLQERERDLPALFAHSLQALEFIAPGISVAAAGLNSPDDCAAYIASYLREHLTGHALYVMDDLHFLAAAPQAERWLRELVRQLPQSCHLVLISRALPDLPLAELIARGDVLAIGQQQLKFTVEEAGVLAKKVGADLPDEQISARVEHLEGWPVGIAMSLRPLPVDLQIGMLRGGAGPEALFDALAGTILRALPPVLVDFLLTASTFSTVTPKICREVLGLAQSGTLMADIVRRNLFASQVAGGLMLHRLFRNFLQRRLQQSDPARFVQLHRRAAEWYRADHHDDEAFEHYMEAGRIEEALDVVQRTHRAYYKQGNMEALLRWRAALGEHAKHIPQFVYTCAMILTDRYLYNDALLEIEIAETGFRQQNELEWVAEVRLQRAQIFIWHGDYRAARGIAEPIAQDTTLEHSTRGRAKQLLALVERTIGDVNLAVAYLEEILPLFEAANDLYFVSGILQDLAVAYASTGDLTSASHCLQRLVAIRRTLGQSNALALALNNLGFHYYKIGDYDLARHTLEEGLQTITQSTNYRAEGYLRWSMGDLQRDLGNTDAALRYYEAAHELSSGAEPLLQQSVAVSMATLYRWRGDNALAAWLTRDVVEDLHNSDAQNSGLYLTAQACHLVSSTLANGEFPALDALDSLISQLSHQPLSADYAQVAMLAAVVAAQRGDEKRAALYLRRCIKSCEQGIARHIVVAELANSPALLAIVNRKPEFRPLQVAFERLRLARSAYSPVGRAESGEADVPRSTYSLRVLTLGDESIECDGVLISTAEWRSSRAKEFFLYLLFEGAASREELSLVFWPDSSSSRVRSNFHTTLYRARRALGENAILFENDLYRINPDVSIWCDALIFKRYVREAQMLSYADVRAEDLYRKAVEYYRGDFLPTLDAEWILSHREALHELHIDALIGAGHCARARQDFDNAIALFKRALKVDPYREEAYRALFTCYAGMGELNRLLKQYDAMSSIFETELGILPSPETHAYVQQLTQHIS
jgi:LuxR family transcriptional regulator, maltose regulon positive regulatory protein